MREIHRLAPSSLSVVPPFLTLSCCERGKSYRRHEAQPLSSLSAKLFIANIKTATLKTLFDARNNHVRDAEQNRGGHASHGPRTSAKLKTFFERQWSRFLFFFLLRQFVRPRGTKAISSPVQFLAAANATHFDPSTSLGRL